jgi:hypothetical protein
MAKRKAADQTLNQRNTAANDKFRNELLTENLDADRTPRDTSDIDAFRKTAYKDALRDAKASKS